ncbi:MAG TPA: ROK family protein [Anaerolineae bacterium]
MKVCYGGIEAGGTKFVCAVGTGPADIQTDQFPTTTPDETISKAIDFFKRHSPGDHLAAIGIGTFGPVDPDRGSPTFGYITTTPKPGWARTDFASVIQRALGVPVGFDTDVNAAALGEHRWGAAQRIDHLIYLTIGTGIGGGALVAGELLHGLIHPEMGHIRIPHDWSVDPYAGFCPFHGDCLEGLAAGPAVERRWGQRGETLPADHAAWGLEANYLALGVVNLICTLSPQRIVMGGGVMQQPRLLSLVRQRTRALLNNYVQVPEIVERIEEYIVAPGLGPQSGVLGAIALAERAAYGTVA